MKLGRTVAELEHTLSADEYRLWLAMYELDPWDEQRADMRIAKLICAVLAPHTRQSLSPSEFMLFPDDAHDIPDDVSAAEQAMMLKMSRLGGGD